MTKIIKEIPFGQATLRLETGELARQASGAVLVSWRDTVVLVTVVAEREANEGRDFFPLTVHYQERFYAAGKIPGGFLKREGRPSEHETLTSRLIDRPLRPLFPEGFHNEVQVIASVLSYNSEAQADILAMIGASAALTISGVPFSGPIGAARVGYCDGVYQLNPSESELERSKLDLVVAGTQDAVLMVESEAHELSEQVMLGAVMFGHEMMQPVIQAINELNEEVGNPPWEYQPPATNEQLENQVRELVGRRIPEAYQIRDKAQRSLALKTMQQDTIAQLTANDETLEEAKISSLIKELEKQHVRGQILAGEPRIDGRDTKTVRPISVRTGLLPRADGSALFTRGETQALVVVTLGNERDAQMLDTIRGEAKQRYMLHYNFPPYSVGETGMIGNPKRREIGHGMLARRATQVMLPAEADFPYVIRVVSEITESNGSSSMASVCGTSLALMDAGVAIAAPVAGVAMGLIKEGDQYAILTDILGDEDHLGDMDFKVAGTMNGVTALQMDIKITGITRDIMEKALNQALQARQHILQVMDKVISEPRAEISPHAPRFHYFKIDPDKIRDVIGKGGVTIRAITEESGVSVDIDDDGTIKLFSPDQTSVDKALAMIKDIVADVEVNKIYQGTVMKIVDFGAFVSVLPGKEGLLHISQISEERINKVSDVLNEGQQVTVKVLAVEPNGRIKLSMKEAVTE